MEVEVFDLLRTQIALVASFGYASGTPERKKIRMTLEEIVTYV
jgi:hypothetical protein